MTEFEEGYLAAGKLLLAWADAMEAGKNFGDAMLIRQAATNLAHGLPDLLAKREAMRA